MTLADERILEFLRDEGGGQPTHIANGITDAGMSYNPKYIGTRCRKLADHGLLYNMGNGLYRLTETGTQYLSEEYDATQLNQQ